MRENFFDHKKMKPGLSANRPSNNWVLGPVVQKPVSANPGLNFNPGFFFCLSKALSQIIFSILFRVSNHQIVGKDNKTEFDF